MTTTDQADWDKTEAGRTLTPTLIRIKREVAAALALSQLYPAGAPKNVIAATSTWGPEFDGPRNTVEAAKGVAPPVEAVPVKTNHRLRIAETPSYVLATEDTTVSFTLAADGKVILQRSSTVGPWGRDQGRQVMTVEAARLEYRRLVKAGFVAW